MRPHPDLATSPRRTRLGNRLRRVGKFLEGRVRLRPGYCGRDKARPSPSILFAARYAGDEGNGSCGRGFRRDGSRRGPVRLWRPRLAAIRLLRTPRPNIHTELCAKHAEEAGLTPGGRRRQTGTAGEARLSVLSAKTAPFVANEVSRKHVTPSGKTRNVLL
jgi:hypothetical protein